MTTTIEAPVAAPLDEHGSTGWDAGRAVYVASVLVIGLYATAALVGGLVAALAIPLGWHDQLHVLAFTSTPIAARRFAALADAAHQSQPLWGITIDYAFSVFNLSLAGILIWLRARKLTSRLLVVALLGTAAVFNLQAYTVWEALDASLFDTFGNVAFHVVTGLAYLLALITFPDGRLVPHWARGRLVILYSLLALVLAAPPLLIRGTSRTLAIIMLFGLITPAVGVLAQAYRRRVATTEDGRQQARILFWALIPALMIGVYTLQQRRTSSAFEVYAGRAIDIIPVELFRVFQPTFAIILLALFAGMVRFRLWGIERLITRTLTYATLAALITAVYIAVVVGAGRLVGTQSDNLVLSIIATGVVALAFGPARDRLSRVADRLVYGRRASALETLAAFSSQASQSVETEDKLSRLAQMIADGTAARRADVWLRVGDELRRVAAAPDDGLRPAPVPLDSEEGPLPPLPDVAAVVPVRHAGELLGALALALPTGEDVAETDRRLLDGLAGQAGLLLRNVRLTAELLDRVRQLRASRQRLVAATDEARRKLERDLHDGAQQQLVALRVKLSLAHRMAAKLGDEAATLTGLLTSLGGETEGAITTLRELAHGIYPPLLAEQGLPAALRSQAAKSMLPIVVEADEDVVRYGQDIEAAIYFCCLEALQNVAKYAEGVSSVAVCLQQDDDRLRFTVVDDGCGFDPNEVGWGAGLVNMTDRLDALGGELTIRGVPGEGTRLTGWAPVRGRAIPSTGHDLETTTGDLPASPLHRDPVG